MSNPNSYAQITAPNNASLSNSGYAMIGKEAQPKQSELTSITFQISEEAEQFADIAAQLEALADRLFGTSPEKSQNQGPRPVPNGAIMEVADRIDGLRSVKIRLINAMSRLSSLA